MGRYILHTSDPSQRQWACARSYLFIWLDFFTSVLDLPETLDNNGLTIIVTYEAKMDDSGKRLSCEVTQIDDEGNKVISTVSTLLKIQEKIPNEKKGLSIALISGMYSR